MNTYGDRAITLVKGQGARVWDSEGKEYLDAISGIAVCGLGHAHPAVTRRISEQAERLIHVSNLYNIEAQQQLGDLLCDLSDMEQVFFSNSGAEANEAALKIARKYGNDKGIHNAKIIVMEQSFHGRTYATLSATGNTKVHAGFEPVMDNFIRVPYDDIAAVAAVAQTHDDVVAIFVEPVQGEGGVHVPASNYLNQLRDICDANQWLLMLDEIQTGNGRTGRYFACQHNNVVPDVMTTAKGLGNGMPIGACMVSKLGVGVLQPGNHGSTFGGNPLACSAGLAVLETLKSEHLVDKVAQQGDYLLHGFREALLDVAAVVDIRGKGLMIGIELNRPCAELVNQAREAGVLINVTAGNTVRLLPTFVMTDIDCDELISKVSELIRLFAR